MVRTFFGWRGCRNIARRLRNGGRTLTRAVCGLFSLCLSEGPATGFVDARMTRVISLDSSSTKRGVGGW